MTTSHHGSPLPAALATVDDSPPSDGPGVPRSFDAGRQDDPKRIEYSQLDRDYSAFYDGEFIGAYPSYHAAERALDDHALYLAEQGLTDDMTVFACPAEPAADVLYACACLAQDGQPGGDGGGGGGPAAIAAIDPAQTAGAFLPDEMAHATATVAPFTRTVRHDLRPPLDALDRDAWRCPEAHIFWVEPGHTPLECPRCDLLAAVYAGEDRARVMIQRDELARFWIGRYTDDPAACLVSLRRYGAGHQRAVTTAIAAYFGETAEAVEWVWAATERRMAVA